MGIISAKPGSVTTRLGFFWQNTANLTDCQLLLYLLVYGPKNGYLVCIITLPSSYIACFMISLYARTIRLARCYRLLFLLLLTTLTAQAQVIRYVSTTGTNANPATATTWATSTTDLQGAIAASSATDQVWVKAGLYKPTSTTARTISFAMKVGVAIYGGFAGTETTLGGRVLTFPSGTTLSGDIGTPASTTDNSYHVFRNPTGLTNSAILDGVVIRDGNANGSLFADTKGGGMYNASTFGTTCSPQLRNCWFINNTASNYGGAMLNDGSNSGTCSPLLVNCLFQDNSATFSGGAIRNEGNNSGTCSPVLANCSFQRNQSPFGGVMFNNGIGGTSSPVLTNCSFQSNTATNTGIMYNDGSSGGASNPVLTNCVVWGNGGASTFGNTVGGSVTVSYSLFESTITGYTNGPGNLTATTSPFSSTTSTQLSPCSPAINAGSPATTTATVGLTDLAGNARFVNNAGTPAALLDMGAYEFQDSQAVPLTPPNGSSFTVCAGQTIELSAALSDFLISLRGAITNDIPLKTASYGPALSATAISGPIKFVGQLTDADQGCAAYPAGTFAGKVALIRRGTCTFLTKVKNAQDAGAIGVLIFNNVAGEIGVNLTGTDATITIPSAGISKENGEAIVGALPAGEVMAKSRLVSYSWAPATGLSSTTGSAVNATPTQITAYTVTASAPGVCTSQTVITVTVTPFPSLTLTASPDLTVTSGQSTTLTVTPGQSITLTASGATSYTWSNGQTTNTLIIPSASTSTYALTGLLGICQRTTSIIINPPVCGSVIYVTQSGAGSQNGSSWANAVPGSGLQMAINTAATCGTQAAVWVANGLYKPALAPGNSPTDRTISFAMQNGVAIYGGFLGSETTLDQRPVINLTTPSGTTLSGEIGNPASTSDNSYHIVSNPRGLTTTAILDGFILTGGNANGTFANSLGGGVLNDGSLTGNGCSPTIRNCLFVNNSASIGGAIYNGGSSSGSSSPILTNCLFQSNTATSSGGAIYNSAGGLGFLGNGSSSPVLTNCSFRNNLASNGGAMVNDGSGTGRNSSPTLTNCSFQSNTATSNGGAMYNYGQFSGRSSPVLTNCVFLSNVATTHGGAIYNNGQSSGSSSPILTNCSFQSNSAIYGGAMFNNGEASGNCSPVLTDCFFTGNVVTAYGGGIYSAGTSGGASGMQLTNCILTGNKAATGYGGGIFNSGVSLSITRCMINENYADNGGGLVHLSAPLLMTNSVVRSNTTVFQASGIQIEGSPGAMLTNCDISGNTSLNTHGGLLHGTGSSAISSLTLINCTVANNTSPGGLRAVWTTTNSTTQTARTFLKNTIVANNPNGNFLQGGPGASLLQSQGNNLDSDGTSSFTNAVNGDLVGVNPLFVSTTDLRLQTGSPAVDAGDPATTSALVGTTDLAGNLRFLGGRIDMGAYEFGCQTATRLYVRASATGANNGSTWADAFTDLQSALTYPCSQSLTEIWVAAGLYKPTSTTTRTASFSILSGVQVYGGFVGTETALNQRPTGQLLTTLSGEIGNTATTADNSYHVVRFYRASAQTRLDGFVITGGNANGSGIDNSGGGIYNDGRFSGNVSSPSIRNCLFTGNTASIYGGALFNAGNDGGNSSPQLVSCAFENNSSPFSAGAIFNNGGSLPDNNCKAL